MRVSDRIAEILVDFGIDDVFMVTGGGSMHLNDGLSRNKSLNINNLHHEQACTMAADGYARLSGVPACVNVTTGPGGINAINGVYGAYTDSVPMIVVSGQVKRETLNFNNSKLRQLGDQENDIISMVKKITKFSYVLKNPNLVDSVLKYALEIATTGRPGPVWIDVPIDIQGAIYSKSSQKSYNKLSKNKVSNKKLESDVNKVLKLLKKAKRPAILVGGGIRASGSHKEFLNFINNTSIPVLTAWNAHDVVHNSHKNYAGRPGTVGDRPGNFIAENCDLLVVLGSRLNIRQIGYNFKEFSTQSFKVMVDIDEQEMNKKTLNIDLKLNYDLQEFLVMLNKKAKKINSPNHVKYLKWCKNLLKEYPVFSSSQISNKKVNPYHFVNELFNQLKKNQIVITSDGTAVVTTFQGAILKQGQRLFSNSGSASMGFGLPAAIGACFASNKKEVICVEGDGSIQMNIQELASIKHHDLPIKTFIFSNEGYHSIRQTQTKYFPDNITGCGPDSGLSFPDFKNIAKAYGLKYMLIDKGSNLVDNLKSALNAKEPIICEVLIDKNQEFEPKASSKLYPDGRMKSAPLYDLYPFLDSKIIEEIINFK
tara:strand:- start:486 stop:2270 length:1785 start_codon:yes stop_codon:yes gene_type:complete